jgi:hypothetical protein
MMTRTMTQSANLSVTYVNCIALVRGTLYPMPLQGVLSYLKNRDILGNHIMEPRLCECLVEFETAVFSY